MKIVCPKCHSRYTITTDRIRIRSFKVRCKRCKTPIVCRSEGPPRWYLALGGVDAGPVTGAELGQAVLQGDAGPETLVWRDGLDDWASLGGLAELAHLLAPPPAAGSRDLFGPPDDHEPLLIGSRNESSVLFSIGNLKALAAPTPVEQDASSGLIDIRSMAPASAADATPPAFEAEVLTPVGPAPVLLPSVPDSGRPAWLFPTLIGMGTVVVVAVVALVLVLATSSKPVEAVKPSPKEKTTKPEPTTHLETDHVMVKRAAVTAPVVAEVAPKPKVRRPAAKVRRPRRPKAPKQPVAQQAPIPGPASVEQDPIARLIDAATGKEPEVKRPREKRPVVQLPSSLTSPQIQRGMRQIKGKVQGCFDRYKVPGWATLNVTIGNDGRVRTARVRGIFSGTPTGGCLKHAVSSAKFPPFASPSLTIEYPFHLREG